MSWRAGGPVSVEMVYAVADNGVIGMGNDMPWRLPSDLRHFKAATLGNPVIMGRRTRESIGRALPGRLNVVVTRDPSAVPDEWLACSSPEEALRLAMAHVGDPDGNSFQARAVSVIGGAQIYNALMEHADRLVVTHVLARPDGDTFMPDIDPSIWVERERTPVDAHPDDSAPTERAIYERAG